jgi:PD-(D/E)XK nuclease superfamily
MAEIKYTWSYSSLDLFKQCPHKYFRLRIKKDFVEPPSEQILYGNAVHKAAEEYIRDSKPLPPQFSQFKEMLDKLRNMEGKHLCEYKMGLTRSLEPCDFMAKDVWWRGIADLLIINGDKARLVDYKTGRSSKNADTKQLELLSLAVFKHFPEVKNVQAGLLFVVANDFIKAKYSAEKDTQRWARWFEDTARLEQALLLDIWNPRPNFTCSKWCPVIDCAHNGQKK